LHFRDLVPEIALRFLGADKSEAKQRMKEGQGIDPMCLIVWDADAYEVEITDYRLHFLAVPKFYI